MITIAMAWCTQFDPFSLPLPVFSSMFACSRIQLLLAASQALLSTRKSRLISLGSVQVFSFRALKMIVKCWMFSTHALLCTITELQQARIRSSSFVHPPTPRRCVQGWGVEVYTSDREIHAPPPQNRRSTSRVQKWGWCVFCLSLRFRQFAHHPPKTPPGEEGLLWGWCVGGGLLYTRSPPHY